MKKSLNKNFFPIGKKLKMLRIKNNLSILDVSKLLLKYNQPTCTQTIYKWENNKINPSIETLSTLAYIYNTSIGSIFYENKMTQGLSESENLFLHMLRTNNLYKKIIFLITKYQREELQHGI